MCLGCASACMFLFCFIYLSFSISVSLSLSHNHILRECSGKRKTKTMEKTEQDHKPKITDRNQEFFSLLRLQNTFAEVFPQHERNISGAVPHIDESCHTHEVVVHRRR